MTATTDTDIIAIVLTATTYVDFNAVNFVAPSKAPAYGV